jgi:hypothetical protein
MKTYFHCKTSIALAVAIAAAVSFQSRASEATVSSSENDAALPAGIPLGSPVGQVFKLAQAGVDASVIQTYITNCSSAFNLQADDIIALTDAGVTSEMLNAMYAHDKTLPASAVAAVTPVAPIPSTDQAGSPPPAPVAGTETAPVPTDVPADLTQGEIDQTLAPYGSWVQVDGYGRCWRPSVVVYDATWQPYCDRGSWVYTDYGWYWNSDYAWGVTFHYGRWFNSPHYGWCWWPNNVWAPAWVTWRSSNAYCGWAPLPPFSVYQPGLGFVYRGNHVAVGFDFGLAANCFTFVSVGHFCEPHPRYYCVPHTQVAHIYGQTAIVNNYGHHNRTIVNGGVSVTFIGNAAHHPIQPVPIGSLVNTSRHGWHGQSYTAPGRHYGASTTDGSSNRQFSHTDYHHETVPAAPAHWQAPQAPENRRSQPSSGFAGRNFNSPAQPSPGPAAPANNHPATMGNASDHNQSRADHGFMAGSGGQQQSVHTYTPPATSQRPQTRSEYREQPRLVAPHYAATTPTIRDARPQNTQSHQNFTHAAPRNITPAAPTIRPAAPRQNSVAGNSPQSWVTRNH